MEADLIFLAKVYSLARNIKESIFIMVNNPTLNRNIGKFNLPHTWDKVLLKTPGLSLKGMWMQLGKSIPIIPTPLHNLLLI